MTHEQEPAPKIVRAASRLLAASCALTLAAASFSALTSPAAGADQKRVTVEFYPPGEAVKVNPVTLSFNGRTYDPLPALPEPGESSNLADDEKFLAQAIAANTRGTLDDILQLWPPDERDAIRKAASDPRIFEANRKAYGSFAKSHLKAKLYYGTYVILIVRHTNRSTGEFIFKDYPVKHVEGKYFLTNGLKADPVFQYITTKYVKKLGGH